MMNKNKFLTAALAMAILGGTVVSCKKDNNNTPVITPPDPIGGFDSSNAVGAANLKAHWTFDGTNNEAISSTAPNTASGASFGTGVKGQGLVLNNGFLHFPTIPNLNSATIGSMTVSCWVKVNNNETTVSNAFGLTLSPAEQADWNYGAINMLMETGHPIATNDTLVFHPSFASWINDTTRAGGDNINDYGVRETDFKTVLGANRWVHYVVRWDAVGSNFDVLADGIVVSNVNFRHRELSPGVGIGSLMTKTPTEVLIGALPNASTGYPNSATQVWQGNFTGSIDEVRFYNTALSDANISALYQLEKAGR